jgi:hypothetical protein
VWLDQGKLNSQSTGDCAPHMLWSTGDHVIADADAVGMDLWKLDGQMTQSRYLEQAEAVLSDQG